MPSVEGTNVVEGYALARYMNTTGGDDERSVGHADNPTTYFFGQKIDKSELLNMPMERDITEVDKMGQFYPSLYAGDFPQSIIETKPFRMVNGIPFRMVYGFEDKDAPTSYVANTTHHIKSINLTDWDDFNRRPRYICFERLGDIGTTELDHEVFGVIFTGITVTWSKEGFLTCTLEGRGAKNSGADMATSPEARIYPMKADDTTEVKNVFNRITTLSWDGEDIEKYEIVEFQGALAATSFPDAAGYFSDHEDLKPVHSGFNIFTYSIPKTLWTDYWAGTPKTVVWKVIKGDTTGATIQYFEITCQNSLIAAIKAHKETNQPTLFNILITCEDVSIPIKDYVKDVHYDEELETP